MHLIAFVLLRFRRLEYAYDPIAKHVRQGFYLGERADPYAVEISETVQVFWHGLGDDNGNGCSLAAHVGFQLLHPVLGKRLGPFAFINDLAAFLSELVPYG